MLSFRTKIGLFRIKIVHAILSCIPKKKGLVLCNAWFGQKYIDNPKYVYEYLLEHSNYKVVWLTKNKTIYNSLLKENKQVVMADSLKGKWCQIRAQAVFSTVQFSDYNQRLLTNTIYLDLGHGHPIKDPGKILYSEIGKIFQNLYINNLNYYGIVASDFAAEKYLDVVPVNRDHIFISDFARNDVFVDEKLRVGKNEVVEKLKNGRKAIVYMPTHRSDGKVKLEMSTILPLNAIQSFCEQNGYVFLIKKHFYHRDETEYLSQYSNIFDITSEPDLDPQVLLYQADVLISDYSACYIDYLLLDRPLMFYQYDLEEYQKKERSFYIPFETLDIAPISYSREEFIEKLTVACSAEDSYKEKRNAFTPHYFKNIRQDNGRRKVKEILDTLMNKYYPI